MLTILKDFLGDDRLAFSGFAVISALALAAAFVSQYVYGLEPCVLCIYQRIPFAVVILLGLAGIAWGRACSCASRVFMGLTTLAFVLNAGIAFYHTGVERKWWASILEGCTVPPMEGNITDVLARIAATPAARCDEIPWTDPVIGLSMANYNVLLCLVLAMAALYSLKLSSK